MSIDRFTGEFGFLSNFSPHSVELDGMLFPTAEHAFQAMKTVDPLERLGVQATMTPGQAKRAGRRVTLREDWEEIKVEVMHRVVAAKFMQHPELADRLVDTQGRELVEGNTWGDRTWGVCDGVGENLLGRILMDVRDELLEQYHEIEW